MQLVANGPNIPDALLQRHADGGVVFFCGAGVSRPAGLPDFNGLVDKIYSIVGTTRQPAEQEAYDRCRFDATLDLLERRLPDGRGAVRRALAAVLTPKRLPPGATKTHRALLKLAKGSDGSTRLVTTNFDRLFVQAGLKGASTPPIHQAPLLPIPKASRWNGVIHLHGLLPKNATSAELNQLVLTSGDFGLAYLTERWASRFIGELFRSYTVCFVGYEINDAVLRYMMDALAADRMMGERSPEAFAFGGCRPGEEHNKTIEWRAKGVTPVLYAVDKSEDHSALHVTLQRWAETYESGVSGLERIVLDHALSRPSASTQQDDFVSRVLWALSDTSGIPARKFATFNPAPPLEWLWALARDNYRHSDLARIGITADVQIDETLKFSLIRRPARYKHAPWLEFASASEQFTRWDKVMRNLASWLVRHLDDPELLLWVATSGGHLHEMLSSLIEIELERFAKLERAGDLVELDSIRANASSAIPRPSMRQLWYLCIAGRMKSFRREMGLFQWKDRFTSNGLTTSLRTDLRAILAPKIAIKSLLRGAGGQTNTSASARIGGLFDWRLELADSDAHSLRAALIQTPGWDAASIQLLEEFQRLLMDALELSRELGEADDRQDRSSRDLPSISEHWQNHRFRDWVFLIDLNRDAWIELHKSDAAQAARVALEWFAKPYPTFKRLALFAASQTNLLSPAVWVTWLLTDNAWCLWDIQTRREVLRLLVLRGAALRGRHRARLEAAILAGPPRSMFVELDDESWSTHRGYTTWLYLKKLEKSGVSLRSRTSRRLASLSAQHQQWRLSAHESEEFSQWMSGSGDPDEAEWVHPIVPPLRRAEIVVWLINPPRTDDFRHEVKWLDACRRRLLNTGCALFDLGRTGVWHTPYWRDALQAWSEKRRAGRSWRFFGSHIATVPDSVLATFAPQFAFWLAAVSKARDLADTQLMSQCERVLGLPLEDAAPTNEPVSHAINYPIGVATEAVLNLWFNTRPNDGDGLPEAIALFFAKLCNDDTLRFRSGRVILASRLIALFRVDPDWTGNNLLPRLAWARNPDEARALWAGFLWSARLYRPLLAAIKASLLETVRHYDELGEGAQRFSALLTLAALDRPDGFESTDFQVAFASLNSAGLIAAAETLARTLGGVRDGREVYWDTRVQPFWQTVWPKANELMTDALAEALVLMPISSGGRFLEALSSVRGWMRPIERAEFVLRRILDETLPERFPEGVLDLLSMIILDPKWMPGLLRECLDRIGAALPQLRADPRFRRLQSYTQ